MDLLTAVGQLLEAGRADAAVRATHDTLALGQVPLAKLAQGIGAKLKAVYAEFHVDAVHDFIGKAVESLPEEAANAILAQVQSDIDLTLHWKQVLDELSNERLINELLDSVKENNPQAAQDRVLSLLQTATDTQQLVERARQVGYTLGGMLHEKERATGLIRLVAQDPQKFGLDAQIVGEMQGMYQKSVAEAVRRERPPAAISRANLVQAVVELGRSLPARNALHEPAAEDIEGFDRNLRAILRSCLLSVGHNKFHEATLIMVEFSQKELSSAGAMAGVEQRLYASLGRTARAVAAKVLRDVGACPVFYKSYCNFAMTNLRQRNGRFIAETLGLLGNADAVPLLIQVMNDKKLDCRAESIFALGAIGDPRGIKQLFEALETNLHARVLEGDMRRDAILIITALGRMARAAEPAMRNPLIVRIVRSLPKNDTELYLRVALGFLLGKLDDFDHSLLEWGARVCVNALWSIDRPELARAARTSPLGFRQPILNLLERMAPHVLPVINQAAVDNAKAYSAGAYLALGEYYGKTPDASALPVLKLLIHNTHMHDDSAPRTAYNREQILDTATEEKTDITKDKVLAALIYAVDKTGGEEAGEVLSGIFEMVQSGRIPAPQRETADILMRWHMKHARETGAPAFPAQETGETSPHDTGHGESLHQGGSATVTEQDLQLMADLEAHYLMASKRRLKKVGAMAQLAHRRVLSAMPIVIRHLADQDPVIAAAALTACLDYASPGGPPKLVSAAIDELLKSIVTTDNSVRVKVAEVLIKMNPAKPPLKDRLQELARREDLPLPARAVVGRLLALVPKADAAADSASEPGAAAPPGTAAGAQAKGTHMSALEKKRQYMLARQEWIRSGKQGPEPKLAE